MRRRRSHRVPHSARTNVEAHLVVAEAVERVPNHVSSLLDPVLHAFLHGSPHIFRQHIVRVEKLLDMFGVLGVLEREVDGPYGALKHLPFSGPLSALRSILGMAKRDRRREQKKRAGKDVRCSRLNTLSDKKLPSKRLSAWTIIEFGGSLLEDRRTLGILGDKLRWAPNDVTRCIRGIETLLP